MERILLIEDNPLLSKLWKTQLKKHYLQVSTAINGYDGLNKVLLEKPDLILLDSVLPELDGAGFLERLRRSPGVAETPVIMLSNFANSEDIQKAKDLGALDYLLKYELTPNELFNKINLALNPQEVSLPPTPGDPLGQLLLDAGLVSALNLERARKEAARTGKSLAEAILFLDLLDSPDKQYLAEVTCRADFVHLSDYTVSAEALALVPEDSALQWGVLPVCIRGSALMVAMGDPRDVNVLDYLRQLTRREIRPVYSTHQEIDKSIILYYGSSNLAGKLTHPITISSSTAEDSRDFSDVSQIIQEQAPVVELLDVLLVKALDERASDIHFEPSEDAEVVRFRIDGILHDVQSLPRTMEPPISARIKILGGMNIAERRLPQDGRFQIKLEREVVDFRVSSVPTIHGEKMVIRVLSHVGELSGLDGLGFEESSLEEYRNMVKRPFGMVVITGPTGSGKTTTLYSTLMFLKSREINLVSIEDPVEYRVSGINQIQVNPKIDLTFANVLRSVLRQDPNIILVGEIRDHDTADLAVQAALTGHLVLTTLHTNNAPGAFMRLVDLEVPPFLVASTINGVAAQRLMRTICSDCRREYAPTPDEIKRLGPDYLPGLHLEKGSGCPQCRATGYVGRTAVFEIISSSREIRNAVMDKVDADQLLDIAIRQGMKTLKAAAWEKVKAGISTLDEMWRVTAE